MATYPIRMLKDENGQPFVPICGINSMVYDDQTTLQEKLDQKLGTDNLIAGDGVDIVESNGNVIVSTSTNYSGTTAPSDSLGKDGDLYILIES
jgi:hypothetical protein